MHGRGLFETSLGPKPAAVSRMVSIDSGCRPHWRIASTGIAAVRVRGDL